MAWPAGRVRGAGPDQTLPSGASAPEKPGSPPPHMWAAAGGGVSGPTSGRRPGCGVNRTTRAGFKPHMSLEWPVGGGWKTGVDILAGCRAFDLEHAVRQRRNHQRHAHRVTIQAALELGEDFGNRRRRPGRRGNQAFTAGARATQVLVWGVDNDLRVGQAVNGCQAAVADAQAFMDHLHYGREAVSRAGGRRHDPMLCRVEPVVIHADDHVERALRLDRRGDYDPLHSLIQVRLQQVWLAELARGLDDHVAARPIRRGQLLVATDRYAHAVDQ